MADEKLLSDTKSDLERLQAFRTSSLSRKADLGVRNFDEAIGPASSLVELFQRINSDRLDIFSDNQLNQIRDSANGIYNLFRQIDAFDGENGSSESRRSIIDQVLSQRATMPDLLAPLISYSVSSSLDPTAMQQRLRTATQSFEDERKKALDEIATLRADAEGILHRVREVAAEQGVSTQSAHFKALAEEYEGNAQKWRGYAIALGLATLAFAGIATFSYRIPWVAPRNNIEAAQLITSKFVILGILGYGLVICVRNFLSQTHNAVVNRHRQNALLTYTAFVDAAPSTASREIVLTHAAASVFSPQDTGYVKNEEPAGGRSMLEMITRASLGDHKPVV